MSFLRDLSIKTKMIGISLLVVAGALASGFTFMIVNDVRTLRAEMMRNTRTTAAFLGESCAAALAFDQPAGAEEVLASLQAIPTILGSSLYDSSGALFSAYQRAGGAVLPDRLDPGLVTGFDGDRLHVVVPIVFRDEEYGTLYLRASTAVLDEQIKDSVLTMLLVMAGMLLLSYFLASGLQRAISRPIIALGETAQAIAESGDYSVRVSPEGRDEVGTLYDRFNDMLEQIALREAERDTAEVGLRDSEEKNRTMLANLEEGFYNVTIDGTLLDHNLAFSRILGFDPDEDLVGTRLPDFWQDPADRQPYLEELQRNGFIRGYPINARTRDGERIVIQANSRIVRDSDGRPVRIEGTFLNITKRKRAEEELVDHRDRLEELVEERTAELIVARERAEESDRLKSAFLAVMSHELRTPLNSIIGFTGMVLQGLAGPLTEEQTKQLGMVQGSGRHLLDLINDVLDISRIEAGKVEIVPKAFDVREAFEKAAQKVRLSAEEKELTLTLDIKPEVGRITSDRRRVEQILINLLNNAVKFTEKGEVRVESRLSEDRLVTCVKDTGIGIEPEELDTVWGEFRQLDTGLNREKEGTGLGLSICKKLVALLGGDIWVESTPGEGSAFTFTLPVNRGQ